MPALRHVVTFTFAETASEDQLRTVVVSLEELPGLIPEIQAYSLGLDAGLGPIRPATTNASMAIVADFASVADFETYRDHPAHRGVIEQVIAPILTGRSAVQYHP